MKNRDLLINFQNKSIALMGHMGSGKTTIGKVIAKNLKYKHVDSDNLIEKNEQKTINQIIEGYGEPYFRKLEEKIITTINIHKSIVLSLGGGSIMSNLTRNFLNENFITVFLDTNLSILTKRLEKSTKRPLLKEVNIEKKIKQLDTERRKYYLLADIITNNNISPEETLNKFQAEYKKLNEKNY